MDSHAVTPRCSCSLNWSLIAYMPLFGANSVAHLILGIRQKEAWTT